MKKLLALLNILAVAALVSCGGGGGSSNNQTTKAFPSVESPSGSDAISASTNRSTKEGDTAPELNPFSGAGFIKPPQINNYGSVSMAYPIETLPGRAGIEPSVGLSYSSSGGDGSAGIGWNLGTGLGVISRTTSNGQLYYDYRDEFTYNGKRLVKVEGSADSENGVYRLEIESEFSKIVCTDAENGGTWTVYDKAGRVTTFGDTLESRIYHPEDISKTYIWNFTKTVDLNGNYMTASYDTTGYNENHILYLKEIKYTGNEDQNYAPRMFVKFTYDDRKESYVSKAAGFIMKMEKILSRVEVGYDDDVQWFYEPQYVYSDDSGRPLLKSVYSSRNTTEPEFIYQPASHSLHWKKVPNAFYNDPEANPENTKYFEGDFNGDGISDMVFFNPETGYWKAAEATASGGYQFKIYGNKFKGFSGEEKIQFFKGNVTGDYDGNGKSDIAFYLPETKMFWVAEHNGKVFNFKSYGRLNVPVDIFSCEWFPGDYDGNGLSDAVLFNESTGQWILMRNLGGSFDFMIFSNKFKNLFRDDYAPDGNMDSDVTSDTSKYGNARGKVHFLNGDYNGDGRTDISIYDERSGKWMVAENYRDDAIGFKLRWKLYKTFTAPEQTLFGFDRFSGDFNGDGFSDFLLFDKENSLWILGETKDGTIDFRIFGETPEFKDITRWLQGDFNGDGRTDIGFYSKTDKNFWVGEATPDGFRYRVYNNINYGGPDAGRIMQTPLPKYQVKISEDTKVSVKDGVTRVLNFSYNSNINENAGELVFAGDFKGEGASLLIYDKHNDKLLYKNESSAVVDTGIVPNLEDSGSKVLFDGRADLYKENPGIIYYNKDSSFGNTNHSFKLIHYSSGIFNDETIAKFDNSLIENFNINSSIYTAGSFVSANKNILILDDKCETPSFYLFDNEDGRNIEISSSGNLTADQFINISEYQSRVKIFTGSFNGGADKVIIADSRTNSTKWYLGEISGNFITFNPIYGNPYLDENYSGFYTFNEDNELVYSIKNEDSISFRKIRLNGSTLYKDSYGPLNGNYIFKGDFDHRGNPIVIEDGVVKVITFDGSQKIENFAPGNIIKIERPDLLEQVYPFNWIQGDYNGDNKTDIGIFHLKEPYWYFAETQGTVPDMIYQVKNGIGGTYEFEYANSSSFDNTGEDSIPDLPMNYKVCTKLLVEDGVGNRVTTGYEYSNGYAFSSFINGKKETDYFGFGTFKVVDAYGASNTSIYYNTPYEDFRKNRALSGAIKESKYIGTDKKEYSKTFYEYTLHEITPDGFSDPASFIVIPRQVKTYQEGILTTTKEADLVLTPGKYELSQRIEKQTDHYTDKVHSETSMVSIQNFENIEDTNEMRLSENISLSGSIHENRVFYTYDDKGNLLNETTRYTGTGLAAASDVIIDYEYDAFGNRIRTINNSAAPARKSEVIIENQFHQFVSEDRSYYEDGYYYNTYKLDYGKAFGQVIEKEDINRNKSYFEYDDYGRLKSQYADTENGKEKFNQYSYDTNFPLSVKFIKYTGTSDTDFQTRVFADGTGRVIHTITAAANGKFVKSGKTTYDAAGRVVRQGQRSFTDSREMEKFYPANKDKYPTITAYDPAGRIKKITTPKAEGETKATYIQNTYNGPWETVTYHSINKSKRTIKNGRDQVLYVEEFGKGDDGNEVRAAMGFAYDLRGNRVKKMDLAAGQDLDSGMDLSMNEALYVYTAQDDSGRNTCQWKYDGFGRVIESYDVDLGYTKIEYNQFGEVKLSKNACNYATTYEYDMLGRLTVKTPPTYLPTNEKITRYTYGKSGASDNGAGRVVVLEDRSQVKTFAYDRLGRVIEETREMVQTGDQFVTRFQYDLINRNKTIEYPVDPETGESMKAVYSYSADGIDSIKTIIGCDEKFIIESSEYNEFGQLDSVKRGNNTETKYSYDIKGRLLNLETTVNDNGQVKTLQDVAYNFRVDNSIRSVTNSPDLVSDGAFNGSISYNYSYDGLNRLINASGNYINGGSEKIFSRHYGYSGNGNLTSKEMTSSGDSHANDTWTYYYLNHRIKYIKNSSNGLKFQMSYDTAGNLRKHIDNEKALQKLMTYDSENRIYKVVDANNNNKVLGEYFYDDQGFRVRKLSKQLRGGEEKDIELLTPSMYVSHERELDYNGDIVAGTEFTVNNIYLDGIRIAAVASEGQVQYYLTDQVDSVKVVVNDAGMPVTNTEYLPYGETWFQYGDTINAPKYNGQELDKETNYYYFNARHYDGEIGRFLTPDSVTDGEYSVAGWNRYMYCAGNPVVYKDPSGHYTSIKFEDREEYIYLPDEKVMLGSKAFMGVIPLVGDYVFEGLNKSISFLNRMGLNFWGSDIEDIEYKKTSDDLKEILKEVNVNKKLSNVSKVTDTISSLALKTNYFIDKVSKFVSKAGKISNAIVVYNVADEIFFNNEEHYKAQHIISDLRLLNHKDKDFVNKIAPYIEAEVMDYMKRGALQISLEGNKIKEKYYNEDHVKFLSNKIKTMYKYIWNNKESEFKIKVPLLYKTAEGAELNE